MNTASRPGWNGPPRVLTDHRNQCPSCKDYFNSDSAFDKHRIGKFDDDSDPRRCMTPGEMQASGMVVNSAGFWVTGAWSGPNGR